MSNTPLVIPQLGNRFIDYRDPVLGDSYNWSFKRTWNDITKLVIHHSVTAPKGNWQTETDEIASLHVNSRGWGGIGYHFVIGSDGVVAYVGDMLTGRANVANNNEKVVGICLVGDFTKHLPTDIQINSAHDLCDYFINHYPNLVNVTSWNDVIGHKETVNLWAGATPTACPGSSWPFDMKDRIRDNVVYTPKPDEQDSTGTPTETKPPDNTNGGENSTPGNTDDVGSPPDTNSPDGNTPPDNEGADNTGSSGDCGNIPNNEEKSIIINLLKEILAFLKSIFKTK